MKKLLLSIVLIVAVAAVFGQSLLDKSQSQINAGFGFSGWGVPVYIGFDVGVSRDITLGAELSYRSYREKFNNHNWDHSVIGISGNANYHFNYILNIPSEWDPYAGINIGYYIVTLPDNYPGDYESQLGIAGQMGVRYYFTEKVGVNVEFGGGNAFSGGKIGISIKI